MAMLPMIAMAASSVMAAAGSVMGGIKQKEASEAEAQEQTYQAREEQQAAGARISGQDYEASQTLAKINANAGAAGVTGAGSPNLVYQRSAEEAQVNDMYARYSGNLAAQKDIYASQQSRFQGSQAQIAGFMQAGGSLLQGASKGYELHKYGSASGAIGGGDSLGSSDAGASLGG